MRIAAVRVVLQLLAELKRRRVFRASAAYIITSWVVLQVADIVVPTVGLPDWSMRLVLVVLVVFFPIFILGAWAYQMTPSGDVRRETSGSGAATLIAVAAITFAVGAGLGWLWSTLNAHDEEPGADRRPRIAVLPLKDMSPNGDKAYFSDGIHEELISRLAEIRSIDVPARTSVARYRDTKLGSRQIARELDVDYLLEGSVRHSADRVLITLQMIDALDDKHVWVQDFDRQLTVENIFDIQKTVAKNVAALLRTQLNPSELERLTEVPTRNLAAYEASLKGDYHYQRYSFDDLRLAVDYFHKATELDANYAAAWSGLASSYAMAATSYGWMKPQEAMTLAKQYGARALELDPYRGGVISLIGDIAYWYDFDPVAAEAKYLEGTAVDPYHLGNRLSYAYLLGTLGRHDEAFKQIEFCIAEQPRAAHLYANAAWRYFSARQYEDTIESADAALAIDPNMLDAHFSRAYALIFLGRLDEAKLTPNIEGHIILQALLRHRGGEVDNARQYVAGLPVSQIRASDMAMLYTIIGNMDEAFQWVDTAIEERHREILMLNTWELFDPLRDDPRYGVALQRLGFATP